MRVGRNLTSCFPLFLWIALLNLYFQPTSVVAFRAFAHDDSHSESLEELPEPLTTSAELKTYFESKGLIGDIVGGGVSLACSVFPSVWEARNNYKQIVSQIVAAATTGQFKGQTYNDLSDFVDYYDRRISGSQLLEDAIDYVGDYMLKSGATNVQYENVTVPNWVRGFESLTLLTPRGERKLGFFGLGQSVATPPEGITGNAIVFGSYVELVANLIRVKGKIVVMNYVGTVLSPLDTSFNGYSLLANAGAIAVLYRSAATFSLNSPHARRSNLYYDGSSPQIPIGYVSFEAGDLLQRLAKRGETINIRLIMQNTNGSAVSRNVFGDLTGSQYPNQFVILAAHTDSWDVSQAAQDDGAGVMLALKALQLLKTLQFTPKRTLRLAFWTAEEWTFLGSAQYLSTRGTVNDLSVALEADYSCLASTGLIWNGHPELGCVVTEIVKLVGAASQGMVTFSPKVSSDVDLFAAKGIPVVTLLGDNGQYFWYHHSEADTMTAVNSTELDRCLALWTSTAYILSDLKSPLLRLF